MQPEAEEDFKTLISADMYYKYEDLCSRPTITPGSEIPEDLLHLSHSFGYDSGCRSNLQVLDDRTVIFMAGNLLVLLDFTTKEQRYLRSCSGEGIGCITTHPRKEYFAAAEKGNHPDIIVYEYPSLRPYRILRGGTQKAYSSVAFNRDGSLLASMGSAHDYMLTLWNWRQEEVMLRCKAISQEVFRVSFSPYNPGQLTSSGSGHIKFWKMSNTFTGLKLEGLMGSFGKTTETDIEGYVELPDGKVISGSDWGNLLLWQENTVKVEICRKEGRSCHVGTVQPFALEDGQLLTFGSDGVVRGWDFESIDTADSSSESSRFEMEPVNEMVVGHGVCLTSVVKSSVSDSFIWFAQDSRGAIWKLDLSFTNTTPDPECLFSFHFGAIQGLAVSKKSHLMATTALDRSVRVFDFLANRELTTSWFSQGGTAVLWAPPLVDQSGSLLVTGFEDGVVRLLELYNPQSLHMVTWRRPKGDAELRLKQAFKPHNAPVTAVAYKRNGDILATGSSDGTVFFFGVGEKYNPIGFVHVPGPVRGLEWSPHSHRENKLLILCQNGHVVEVQSPDPEAEKATKTFQLPELPRRSFRFRSIKSRIKREEEIARRQALKESKNRELKQPDTEEEDDLPPIYIPSTPSPLYCGFYSVPGQFWLSMGGYDSGFLYHCKFSEKQNEDPDQQQDEPFDFLPVNNTDNDPIRSITFSYNRQLLLCGMHSGSIRVYPLQPGDHSLTSMQAYWALSVHDNQYGHLQHIRCSHDDYFVLTAGDDGNIFSFGLLSPEEQQKILQTKRAKIPSPRVGLENEALVQDIEDPAAYSIEMANQKQEKDQLRRETELKKAEKRQKLAELQKTYKQLLSINQSLPENFRLTPKELDPHFYEQAERMKSQRMMEVRRQFAWEEERCNVALSKLQNWFRDSLGTNMITVVAIGSDHRLTTYRLPVNSEPSTQLRCQSASTQSEDNEAAAVQLRRSRAKSPNDTEIEKDVLCPPVVPQKEIKCGDRQIEGPAEKAEQAIEKDVLCPPVVRQKGIKFGDWQIDRLRKAAEKAEQAQAKIEKRKQEWDQLYAEKPDENYDDPQHVQAIQEAKENIGDLKLKSSKDYRVPLHLRMNVESKTEELMRLEKTVREKQSEMNERIVALRDSKVRLVTQLKTQGRQLQKVQRRLAAPLHRPPPALPVILPEEIPEKRLQYTQATLEKYSVLRGQRTAQQDDPEGTASLLEQLEKEMQGHEEQEEEGEEEKSEDEETLGVWSVIGETEEPLEKEGVELSELQKELQMEEEIILLHKQDSLLEQMETSVCQFDAELRLLRHQKLLLDWQLKLTDLRQVTLYQELLILQEFKEEEDSLEEKLSQIVREKNKITSKLAECKEQLKLHRREKAKLRMRKKALVANFLTMLGENNFKDFLTKVFYMKVKGVKKEEQTGTDEQDVYSDPDIDEAEDEDYNLSDDSDDYDSDTNGGGAPVDDSVCPKGCEPVLFMNTLQLREHRLDLEELLAKEKKSVQLLKRERDNLTKEEKSVKSRQQAVENKLDVINKEKQEKINDLDVVVPLRLHQIKFMTDGSVPSDLSSALVVDRTELNRLQERVKQVQVEKRQQRELCRQARQHHARLINERKEMHDKILLLQKQCNELMMKKFGRLVDLEAMQTQSGNRKLLELKQEKLCREAAYAKELKQWDAKVEESQQALMEVTKRNTERVLIKTSLINQKRELEHKLNTRQKKMGRQFVDHRRCVDQAEIQRLQTLVKTQQQQAKAIRREIDLLSRKGGHVLPPGHDLLPPNTTLATPGHVLPPGRGLLRPIAPLVGRGAATDFVPGAAGHLPQDPQPGAPGPRH